MTTSIKPELISFNLCPYVQRSVITLLEKGVDFDITYIDLAKPPDWFLKISPFGKVPALRVGDTTLFESAVINEYLDETHPPSMHPADALRRAHNRAWIEFGSSLLVSQFEWNIATEQATLTQKENEIRDKLAKVEAQLGAGPYFNGPDFSLVDAAYAPAFMRLALIEEHRPLGLLDATPRVRAWSKALLAREAVRKSVVPDFERLYVDYLKSKNSLLAGAFA